MVKKIATPSLFPETRGNLHLGPYFPVLEEAFLALVRARTEPLAPLWVLAPTGEMQRRLRGLIAEQGGALNIRFFGFESLAEELSSQPAGRLGLSPLPPGGGFLLMEEILREVDLGYFAPAKNAARFSNTLLATIRDLRDAGVGVETLARAAKSKLGAPGKIASLARILEAWETRLAQRKLYDGAQAFHLATTELAEGRAPLPEPFALAVYGIADFTGAQRRLLESLAARAHALHAFLPPESEFSRPALAFFRGIGLEEISAASPKAPAARRISAAGRGEEVRECLREILTLLESGLRPEEIGIVARSVEPYETLLRDRFAATRLPLALAKRPSLAQSEPGRALLAALALGEKRFARREIFSWLRHPGLDLPRLTGLGEPPLAEWDRLLREAGVARFEKDWERRVQDRALLDGMHRALAALQELPQTGSPRALSKSLQEFARHYLRESEEREPLCEALQSLSSLESVCSQIEAAALRPLLDDLLGDAPLPAKMGGIFFGDAMRARGLSFRALFVLGLVAKEFPRPPRLDPVLLDAEREALRARFATEDLQLKSRGEFEEPFLFESLQASAREKLFFLRPRLDPVNGREILPSPYWGDPKSEEKAPLRFWSAKSRGEAASLFEFDLRCTDALASLDRDLAASYLRDAFSHSLASGLDLEAKRWSANRYTDCDGDVGAQAAAALAGLRFEGAIAPTRLEALAGCPFRFFLEAGLQVAPLEEPESESSMDARERGSLLHKILAGFFRGLTQGKTLDWFASEELDAQLQRVFDACWKEKEREGISGAWADREAARVELLGELRAYLAAEVEAKSPVPARVEWEIPQGIEFRAGKYAFPLRGRVDRIDLGADGSARVVDFKSNKRPDGIGTLQGGRRIQVPLYSFAVSKALGVHPVSGEYHYFRDGKRATLDHDGDSAALRQAVETLIDLGKSGLYPQIPKYCERCEVKLACPSEPKPVFARKQGDPRLQDFLALHRGELEPAKADKPPKTAKVAKKRGKA